MNTIKLFENFSEEENQDVYHNRWLKKIKALSEFNYDKSDNSWSYTFNSDNSKILIEISKNKKWSVDFDYRKNISDDVIIKNINKKNLNYNQIIKVIDKINIFLNEENIS